MMRILRRHATERTVERTVPAAVDCNHSSASGVDDTPVDDVRKVWCCDSCGLTFRYELVPGKPYFFHSVTPVRVVS